MHVKVTLLWLAGYETVHGELQTHGFSGEGLPYIDGTEGYTVQEVHHVSFVWFLSLWFLAM